MADEQQIREGNDYGTYFNPTDYLEGYYKQIEGPMFVEFVVESVHKMYSKGNIKGKKILDIGCGPCIHMVMPAAKWFEEIILADFTPANRTMQEKWLNKEEGARDWTPFFKYYSHLDKNEDKWEDMEKELRNKIKRVIPCNVLLSNPLQSEKIEAVDAITTSLCLEAACSDLPTYTQAVKNIASLLKPKGKLVIMGILNNPYYRVGNEKFFALPMRKEDILTAVKEAGLTVLETFDDFSHSEEDFSPYNGNVIVHAEKNI